MTRIGLVFADFFDFKIRENPSDPCSNITSLKKIQDFFRFQYQ